MLTAVTVVMFIVLFIQGPSLYIYKKWKELVYYLLFWAIATSYALLVVSPVDLVAPSRLITRALTQLQDLFTGYIV